LACVPLLELKEAGNRNPKELIGKKVWGWPKFGERKERIFPFQSLEGSWFRRMSLWENYSQAGKNLTRRMRN